ncbi:hypothetical protein AHAS_Ahas11G0135900 [Arachis hypogaea]
MEDTANIMVYHNGEVVRNTYEEADIVKRVTNILYRSSVVVFGDLIQFEVMPILDETSIQRIFHIHQQTQVQHPRIELYVEFEHIATDEVQHDPDVQDDKDEA